MRRKHPGAVDYYFDEVLPSENAFKFVLDNDPPQGSSIYQLITNSEVSTSLQLRSIILLFQIYL